MRTTIQVFFLGAALGVAPLSLQAGCEPSGPTQGAAADSGASPDSDGSAPSKSDGGTGGNKDLSQGGGTADLAGSANPEADPKLQGITALHNQARATVNPAPATAVPPLAWSTTVAAAAQLVANSCMFSHSGNGYGENIYASAGSGVTPSVVVKSWTMEASNYNYAANTCMSGKTCGHYTQVVWRGSQRLGCAQKTCTTGSPFPGFPTWDFWVCDYDPPGNSGGRPY